MTQIKNARFWEPWKESFVKLTLRPGQRMAVYEKRRTDEGWASEYASWEHQGGRIVFARVTDGRDCDGRLRTSVVFSAQLDALAEVRPERAPELLLPVWKGVSTYTRDYAAEAMNY